jgi:hypothetical protein
MTEDTENLVLEHLRRLRLGQDEILGELHHLKGRVTITSA